ncbi:MAG: hypothetical protein ACYCQI_04605 [Gammaproteobacteria bacterium]
MDDNLILEIGEHCLIKRVLPERTEFLFTGNAAQLKYLQDIERVKHSVRSLASVYKKILNDQYDLIVIHAPCYAPWDYRRIQYYIKSLQVNLALRSIFTYLCHRTSIPIVVLDLEDHPLIYPHNLTFLDRSLAYFKRELPTDPTRLFAYHKHPYLPTHMDKRLLKERLAKIRPISLGISAATVQQIPSLREKEYDIFFSGQTVAWSSVRERGVSEIEALARKGYKIDFAKNRLPLGEYLERCARAHLVWSPEGLGWDCFRHYEAAACFSVPLISQPTIQRYKPLLHGIHCYYYGVEEGGLIRAAEYALKDLNRLEKMAKIANRHVMRYFTHEKLCAYILERNSR